MSPREDYAVVGRPGQGAATRSRIVRVAADLFAKRGFAGTAIDDIADASAVSKGTVYHYFSDKQELFGEVYACAWAQAGRALDEAHAPATLAAGVEAILGAAATNSAPLRALSAVADQALGATRRRYIERDFCATLLRRALSGDRPGCRDSQFVEVAMDLVADLIHDALRSAPEVGADADVIAWLVDGLSR
ncbi:TetR/AcrR family transcriptional regulator [Gordonia sp. TBRC 11910]|uniref:TetR/AcrR family transcriptional regulator n=1 Tax=Gordonia asplenii TaxID=2725283 RepID=A0A848KY25_9ACTN|nr:TetR/AcrR family transcriptional regulator [Gordonia asplenii]NMO01755.1 TetR/AcrR family transcriptional regulator [Gordonia asplenii]